MTDHQFFPGRVETRRLRLEPLTAGSVREYYRVRSGQAGDDVDLTTRYVPWDPHEHPKETLAFLERIDERRESGETADDLVRSREGEDGAGEFAGAVGLTPDWDCHSGELGAWLCGRFWDGGYAGEAWRVLTRLAFERLDLELVVARARADNDPSNRALEKFVEDPGGRREGPIRNGWRSSVDDRPYDEARYSVHRAEWRAVTEDRSYSKFTV
ncbi:GNAT family N-acetyltransferase [Halobacteriales archaeon QS_8_69_26]|nr:MAG: GNAT family N-acetyltransferase [Halobacteriales archaeon QS_8_69_26]